MLIEFSVSNYRSFAEKQTLSLVANAAGELKPTNTFSAGIQGLPHLLRSAVIYGPNASGKSNLVRAMLFAGQFVRSSAQSQLWDEIEVVPFFFDPDLRKQPSEFEWMLIQDGVRYQ